MYLENIYIYFKGDRTRSCKTSIMGMLLIKINFPEKTAKKKFNILIYVI